MSSASDDASYSASDEKLYCLLVAALLVFDPIQDALSTVIDAHIELPFRFSTIIVYIPVIVLVFKVMPKLMRFEHWSEFIPVLVVLLMMSVTMILRRYDLAEQEYFVELALRFACSCIPYYLIFRCCNVNSYLIRIVSIASVAAICACVVNYTFTDRLDATRYSQFLSYQVLLPCLACSQMLFYTRIYARKLINAIAVAVGFWLMLKAGARGPLIISAAFFVFCYIFGEREEPCIKPHIRIATSIAVVVLAGVFGVALLSEEFAELLNMSASSGGSGRLSRLLGEGQLLYDGGRSHVYGPSVKLLLDNPLLGCGLGYERIYIANAMGVDNYYGCYPHNLFLEIMIQFGLIAGAAISVAILALLVKAYSKACKLEKMLIQLLFMGGFVPLLVSGSYLSSPLLYALIGLCVNIIRRIFAVNS